LLLFEQVAQSMEVFAIAHEYGHHHFDHGRQIGRDPHQEEIDADKFALRISYEIERRTGRLSESISSLRRWRNSVATRFGNIAVG